MLLGSTTPQKISDETSRELPRVVIDGELLSKEEIEQRRNTGKRECQSRDGRTSGSTWQPSASALV